MKLRHTLFVLILSFMLLAAGCSTDSDSSSPTAATPSTTGGGNPERGSSGNLVVSDPLTNGTSSGIVAGGAFTAEGYHVTTNNGGYVMYPTNVTGDIRIEFDAKGYIPAEQAADSKLIVIQLYDSDPYANWRVNWASINAYLYQLRKRGAGGEFTDALDLKFGSAVKGVGKELWGWRGDSVGPNPLEWDPNKTYHWVVTVANGKTEVYRDGQIYYSVGCATEFAPTNPIVVRIGGTSYGALGPRDVTYSNVTIYDL
jgi:hypothetical protein